MNDTTPDIGFEIQLLREAADVVLKRGLTERGVEELTEYSGDIAAMGASFVLLFQEIEKLAQRRAA